MLTDCPLEFPLLIPTVVIPTSEIYHEKLKNSCGTLYAKYFNVTDAQIVRFVIGIVVRLSGAVRALKWHLTHSSGRVS